MPEDKPAAVDRIKVAAHSQAEKTLLHKMLTVQRYEKFEFVVPPHTVTPRMQGTFQSFVKNETGGLVSNDSANVDILLLNEQEFDDFSHGREGTATYSVDPSHSQSIDCAIAGTLENPATYYLIIRNPPGGAPVKYVQGDFTVSFE
jgi:hypothetical protein